MTKRELAIACAKVAGYHNDAKTFTRLRIVSRVSIEHLNAAWANGVQAKSAGVPCSCSDCTKVSA